MSNATAHKILKIWKQHVPTEADVSDVMAVVNVFLGDITRDIGSPGSHVKEVFHPMFQKLNLFDGHGRFSIVVHKGKVKKCYIKDILKAIDTLEMIKRVDGESKK